MEHPSTFMQQLYWITVLDTSDQLWPNKCWPLWFAETLKTNNALTEVLLKIKLFMNGGGFW